MEDGKKVLQSILGLRPFQLGIEISFDFYFRGVMSGRVVVTQM
jgi:hypothetical protein